jgi:hypothetical protein
MSGTTTSFGFTGAKKAKVAGTKKRPIAAEQRNTTLNDELSRYPGETH